MLFTTTITAATSVRSRRAAASMPPRATSRGPSGTPGCSHRRRRSRSDRPRSRSTSIPPPADAARLRCTVHGDISERRPLRTRYATTARVTAAVGDDLALPEGARHPLGADPQPDAAGPAGADARHPRDPVRPLRARTLVARRPDGCAQRPRRPLPPMSGSAGTRDDPGPPEPPDTAPPDPDHRRSRADPGSAKCLKLETPDHGHSADTGPRRWPASCSSPLPVRHNKRWDSDRGRQTAARFVGPAGHPGETPPARPRWGTSVRPHRLEHGRHRNGRDRNGKKGRV